MAYRSYSKIQNDDWRKHKGIFAFLTIGMILGAVATTGPQSYSLIITFLELTVGLVFVYRGIKSIQTGKSWIPRPFGVDTLNGTSARILGIIYLAIGVVSVYLILISFLKLT